MGIRRLLQDPRVEGGEVRFSVPRRTPGHPFVVRAERYRVVVIGTRFGVAVDDHRNVAVNVREGVVEVWGGETRLARLVPGDSWRSPEIAPAGQDDGARAEIAAGRADKTMASPQDDRKRLANAPFSAMFQATTASTAPRLHSGT